MSIGNTSSTVGFGILSLGLALWCFRNIYMYFVIGWTSDGQEALDEFGVFFQYVSQENKDMIAETLFYPMFNERKIPVFLHVFLGVVWSFTALINLWTAPPNKQWTKLHKISGNVFMVCGVAMALAIYPLIFNSGEGFIMKMNEYLVATIAIFFAFKGYRDIRQKKYSAHRKSMIMATSSIFNLFLRRPIFGIFHALVPDLKTVSVDFYREAIWGGTAFASLILCQGTAIYLAYGSSSDNPKIKAT